MPGRRSTKAEMQQRYALLKEIVDESAPTGIRFVFYRAVSLGIPGITKDDNGYEKVQRALVAMREEGMIDFSAIVDNTRFMRKPSTYPSASWAMRDLALRYRRDYWFARDEAVEVWVESESAAGVLMPVTRLWDIPLYPVKGQSSNSFVYSAAESLAERDAHTTIYYFGDYDPAGLEIASVLQHKLAKYSKRTDFDFVRLGVTPEQAQGMGRVGRTPKKTTWSCWDSGVPEVIPFHGLSYEVESIDAPVLRDLLYGAIAAHIDPEDYAEHEEIEEQEKATLIEYARNLDNQQE